MTEKPIVRIDWYADNWLGGVALLNAEERGVYDTLINLIYQRGGPIEDDDKLLASASNCGRAAYRRAKQRLLDLDKIKIVEGRIHQAKCGRELEAAKARMEAYRQREIRKKRQKNEQKTSKKSEKTGAKNQEKQANPRLSITGDNRQQSVVTSKEGNNKTGVKEANSKEQEPPQEAAAVSAPPCENGRSLPAGAKPLITAIQAQAGQSFSLRDWDALKASIINAGPASLTVHRDWWEQPDNQRMVEKAESAGVTIEPQTELKVINGGRN